MASKSKLSIFVWVLGIIFVTTSPAVAGSLTDKGPQPTPFSMDFYGHIEEAEVGDTLSIYDPDGVLCGEFVVKKAGQYGFVHVYGDDRSTDADEGAKYGDELRFELNGEPLNSTSEETTYWIGDGQRKQVDFTR